MLRNEYQPSVVYRYYCERALKKHKAKAFDDNLYNAIKDTFYADKSCADKIKNEFTVGKCHYYALLLAKALDGATLCTGNLNALNYSVEGAYYIPFEHSWVEIGNYVFDTTSKQVFNKDYYYKYLKAEKEHTYTHEMLQDEKLFFSLGVRAIKDRDELLTDFVKIFGNVYLINKGDNEFTEKCFISIENNEKYKKEIIDKLNSNNKNVNINKIIEK